MQHNPPPKKLEIVNLILPVALALVPGIIIKYAPGIAYLVKEVYTYNIVLDMIPFLETTLFNYHCSYFLQTT